MRWPFSSGFLGGGGGEGQNAASEKKIPEIFFFPLLKGMERNLILEVDTNPSTVSGLGSGSSDWLVCGDISVLQTLVWGP